MSNLLSFSQSSKNLVLTLIVFVLALDLAFVGQKLGGAYQNEFGADPHEAAHYMASLFWRDLAVSLWRDRSEGKAGTLGEKKVRFMQNWAAHYPFLETGGEHSLFNAVGAVWMLAFPATRGGLLVLLAALSAVWATQLCRSLQPDYGWLGGGLAAVFLLALPAARRFTGLVTPDVLSGIFLFGAVMAFGNYLDRDRSRYAWAAGLLGAAAIFNSEAGSSPLNAILVSMIVTGKLRWLRRRAVWGVIALLLLASAARTSPSESEAGDGLISHLIHFGGALGWGVFALMIIGVIVTFARTDEWEGRWKAALAFLVFAPTVFVALPAAVMFALAGGAWLVNWVSARLRWGAAGGRNRWACATALGALALLSASGSWRRESWTGFAPLAETLLADAAPGDVTLVSSDPGGEERFIAELAMREERPSHPLLCGTQILANPGKKFIANEPAFPDDQAMFDFLVSGKIKYIVMDDAVPDELRREHHYQLRRAIEEHLNRFWVIATCPVTRDGVTPATPAKLYKIKGID